MPITILGMETGAVSKSCSVLVLFSSLKDFIVRIGSIIARIISTKIKYVPVDDVAFIRVVAPRIAPKSAKEMARKI